MDEIGKDRRGVTLIGEILLQLAQRENIRRRLADLEAYGGPDLVRRLLDEFEQIVDSRYLELQKAAPLAEPPAEPTPETREIPPPPVVPESSPQPPAAPPVEVEKRQPFASIFTVELPEAKEEKPGRASVDPSPRVAPEPPVPRQIPPQPKQPIVPPARSPEKPTREEPPPEAPVRKPVVTKHEEPSRTSVAPPPEPFVVPPARSPEKPLREEQPVVVSEEPVKKPVEVKQEEPSRAGVAHPMGPETPIVPPAALPVKPTREELPLTAAEPQAAPSAGISDVHYDVNPKAPGREAHPRISYELADDDAVYLHAVAQIPLEERPTHVPFMLEEKGIEYKDFAFALDRGGLRFYLSRIAGRNMNVSKTGVLLLNKHESIRVRGTHFGILNDLRAHGVLLPFAFGSVALGKEDLYAKIDDHMYEIRDALDEVLSTKWWDLNVYVLDVTMAQMLTPEGVAARRERERRTMGSRPTPTVGRIDIKALERVLGKQKKIAESIHEQLKDLAVRSDVDMIVGLNSGSSDDWKLILKASYEVSLTGIHRFNRAVTDLQYHHVQYEIMFVLSGDCAEFSFRES
jgi:hypothetical protein